MMDIPKPDPSRFFASCDGSLTRVLANGKLDNVALRPVYAGTVTNVTCGRDVVRSIRAGQYAWPGGYEIVGITSDGGCLCMPCIRHNLFSIIHSIRNRISDGWKVEAFESVESAESFISCDHCNRVIVEWEESDDEDTHTQTEVTK